MSEDTKGQSPDSLEVVADGTSVNQQQVAGSAVARGGGWGTFVTLVGVVLLCVALNFFRVGFDVKNNYYNSSLGYSIHAYVGGDAYNYIINASYFAGYLAIGSGCLVSGFVALGTGSLLRKKSD